MKRLEKVFVITCWSEENEQIPMWATDTYEKAVSDIQNYCEDEFTYTIVEVSLYTAPNYYYTED